MPGGCRARTGQTTSGIADDRGGSPKPLLEEMIRQVLQSGLDAPVVLAGDEHESIGFADLAGQRLKGLGRLALWIFLVHPVEYRKVDCLGVDQLGLVASAPQLLDHISGEPDAHPVGSIGTVEDEDAIAHGRRLPKFERLRRSPGMSPDDRRSSLLRQLLAGLLGHDVLGVPVRPVGVVLAAIALLVLAMGGRGAAERSGEFGLRAEACVAFDASG